MDKKIVFLLVVVVLGLIPLVNPQGFSTRGVEIDYPEVFCIWRNETTYNYVYESFYNKTYQDKSNLNISSKTCAGTDKVSAMDNATGIVTCSADAGGGGDDTWAANYTYYYNKTVGNLTYVLADSTNISLNYSLLAYLMWDTRWTSVYNKTYQDKSNLNISTTTCTGTDKVSAINNATGVVTCTADTGGGGVDTWATNITFYYNSTASNINYSTNNAIITMYGNNSMLGSASVPTGGLHIVQTRPEGKSGIWWDAYDLANNTYREVGWIVCHYNSTSGATHSHCSWETLDNTTGTPSINSHFTITYNSSQPLATVSFPSSNIDLAGSLINVGGTTNFYPGTTFNVYPSSQTTIGLRFSNNTNNYTLQVLGSSTLQFSDDLFLPSNNIIANYFVGNGSNLTSIPISSYNSTYQDKSNLNITTTACSGTDKVSAINNVTGLVTCTADTGGVSNPFDQDLNTTANVTFARVTLNGTNSKILKNSNSLVIDVNYSGISGLYIRNTAGDIVDLDVNGHIYGQNLTIIHEITAGANITSQSGSISAGQNLDVGGDSFLLGNVGIGTSTPLNKLYVVGDINLTGNYFGNASKLNYVPTFNSTYDSWATNISRNYSLLTWNSWMLQSLRPTDAVNFRTLNATNINATGLLNATEINTTELSVRNHIIGYKGINIKGNSTFEDITLGNSYQLVVPYNATMNFTYGGPSGILVPAQGGAGTVIVFGVTTSLTTGLAFNVPLARVELNRGGTSNVYWSLGATAVGYLKPTATAPATCTEGEHYNDDSGASCYCYTANTWENMGTQGTCT